MDILKYIAELHEERKQINDAIKVFEGMARGMSRRRGRPPAWMAQATRRGRPVGSKNKAKTLAAAA